MRGQGRAAAADAGPSSSALGGVGEGEGDTEAWGNVDWPVAVSNYEGAEYQHYGNHQPHQRTDAVLPGGRPPSRISIRPRNHEQAFERDGNPYERLMALEAELLLLQGKPIEEPVGFLRRLMQRFR